MKYEKQLVGVILAIFIVILAILAIIYQDKIENAPDELLEPYITIQNNSLVAVSPLYLPHIQVLADRIVDCESRGKMVWGDLDKEHPAFGVAQFQKRTFDWLNELRGTTLNYFDEQDQRSMLYWAIKNGYIYLWSCSSKIQYDSY